MPRLPGRDAAAARRAADGRLFPPCPRHRSRAAVGAARPRRRRSARTWCARPTASGSSTTREAAGRPETWLALFQAAIDSGCAVSDEALACVEQNVGRFTRRAISSRPPTHRDALMHFLKPRPGLYARLSEMHDAGLLGQMFPGVQGDQLPGGPRLLSQVHGRRAHAADDPQPRAADRCRRRERERFARLLGELEAPELLVLSLLYHDVGKGRDDRSLRRKRRGWPRRCATGCELDDESRATRRVPGRASTSRCRSSHSGATPRTRKSSASSPRWSASKSGSRCCAC